MKKLHFILIILTIFSLISACKHKITKEELRMLSSDGELEYVLEESVKANINQVEEIEKRVEKSGNTNEGKNIIKVVHQLRQKTNEILDKIDRRYKYLFSEVGNFKLDIKRFEDLKLENNDASNEIYVYMLKGKGKELLQDLKNYNDFLETIYSKIKIAKLTTYQAPNDDFFEKYFNHSTVLGAGIVLRHFQLEIIEKEEKILELFKQKSKKLEGERVTFMDIHAFVEPERRTVKVGEPYRAKVYLAAVGISPSLKMYSNGIEIPVEDGVGTLRFTPNRLGKQTWEGKISLNIKGRDTTFKVLKTFEVVE